MGKRTHVLGHWGERFAEQYLNSRGLTTVERNWRSGKKGEIDLVMRDRDSIVFIEVKTRRDPNAATETIDQRKLQRLRGLAAAWLRGASSYLDYRIDLVGVVPSPSGAAAQIHWWKGIDR